MAGRPQPPPRSPHDDDDDDWFLAAPDKRFRDVGVLAAIFVIIVILLGHGRTLRTWHDDHRARGGNKTLRLFVCIQSAHLVWVLHLGLTAARGVATLSTGHNWIFGRLACEAAARLVSSLYTSGYALLGGFFRWKFAASRSRAAAKTRAERWLVGLADACLCGFAACVACWIANPFSDRAADNGPRECGLKRDFWFASFVGTGYVLWIGVSGSLLFLFLNPLLESVRKADERSGVQSDELLRAVVRRNFECFAVSFVSGVVVASAIVLESVLVEDDKTSRGLATCSTLGPALDMYVNSACALHSLNLQFAGGGAIDRAKLWWRGGDGDGRGSLAWAARSTRASAGRRSSWKLMGASRLRRQRPFPLRFSRHASALELARASGRASERASEAAAPPEAPDPGV